MIRCNERRRNKIITFYLPFSIDQRECTFQPNMQKYGTHHSPENVNEKDEQNSETDCFNSLLGFLEKHKVRIKQGDILKRILFSSDSLYKK
jgi:hypothetical protein